MKRWSKLQRDLYNIIDSDLQFQIQCRALHRKTNSRKYVGGRVNYIVTIGKGLEQETIFNLMDEFLEENDPLWKQGEEVTKTSELIREYIESSREELVFKNFANDRWGLTDILKCSDRRIGKRSRNKLAALILTSESKHKDQCMKILNKRFGLPEIKSPEADQQLKEFDEWAENNEPKKTDVNKLREKLKEEKL